MAWTRSRSGPREVGPDGAPRMRLRVSWTAAETVPGPGEVFRLQGIPSDAAPPPRIEALLETARREYVEMAEPRAVACGISAEDFAGVYRGEGRNAPETPLERIYPGAARLALFTATVGAALTGRIRTLFGRNEAALAVMLDAVASAAADRLAEILGVRFLAGAGGGDDASGWSVLAYSPGYCGWHVSGQRALFGHLAPEEIGVTLNASCLMDPLKSVSGVLVAGPGSIHRFPPDYPFCDDCEGKPCRARIASLSRS